MTVIMKRLFFFASILVFSVVFTSAFASEISIFGPTQFIRTTGEPDVYSGTFTAPFPDDVTAGKLIVLNGNQIGEHRVEDAISSAEVLINGVLIFGPNDFNKNVYYLEAPVIFGADNAYYIELRSESESYLTIDIVQDFDPPTLTVSADPDAIKVDGNATLTWSSTLAYH